MCVDRSSEEFDPVEAVNSYLSDWGFSGKIFHTEQTIFTVSDASSAVGAPEEKILKSILLRVNRGEYFALALMSGINRVNTKNIKKILGSSHVSFAKPDDCFNWSGFKPGGVPPVGYPKQPRTLLDEDLFKHLEVWAAAGTDHDFFPVSPEELMRMTGGEKADIKK